MGHFNRWIAIIGLERLTVYLDNGKRYNGKVITPGYLRTMVQIAGNGQRIKVKNNAIRLVSTDHQAIKFKA